MTCASSNADCDVKIATGEILAVSISYVKPSLVNDTVICLSQEIELTASTIIFSQWNRNLELTATRHFSTDKQDRRTIRYFSGLQSGNIYGLIYTASQRDRQLQRI
jgi:hypothetical protein